MTQNTEKFESKSKLTKFIKGRSRSRVSKTMIKRKPSRSKTRPAPHLSPKVSKSKLVSNPKKNGKSTSFNSSTNIHQMVRRSTRSSHHSSKPEPGSINDFRLYGKKLGEGAYAVVRPAKHLETGEIVAIKTYNRLKLVEPKKLRAVRREIDII